jgi:hypothetical protein
MSSQVELDFWKRHDRGKLVAVTPNTECRMYISDEEKNCQRTLPFSIKTDQHILL